MTPTLNAFMPPLGLDTGARDRAVPRASRFQIPMSNDFDCETRLPFGRCESGVLLVGLVAATSALGDRSPEVERTDTRSTSAAMSRVALGGILRFRLSVHPPRD